MVQQGQVLKLKARGGDGQPLWVRTATGSRGAGRRGRRLAGSRLALTR